MNKQNKLIEINPKKLHTFFKDENGKNYIKLPIRDYQELELLRFYIAYTIGLMGEAHEYNKKGDDFSYAIIYLSKLLQRLNLNFDVEVLDEVMKNQ